MSNGLHSLTAPGPCGARITPTRTMHWRAMLHRLGDRLRAALEAAGQGLQRREPVSEFDVATLRDLGLGHLLASRTPRERMADPWR